ncbi:DNA primase [uncultured Peptoniphilus sp.]|uniref:DNA primase n=1 Tax=uncultured Peptoniphilus sp. TaxID=254354 RepID=UPI002803C55C|nr:DNA primase [uncultured Peptoniphilus sp.]
MSFLIDDVLLEEIRDRAEIYEFISGYVDLKRSGSNYMGLCPFHSEKTPSFSVSPSKGIFKCFGCGEGGDVITFAMKRENLSFTEAIKFLAEKYNIELKKSKSSINREEEEKKKRFFEINKEAARLFFANLRESKAPLFYLQKRGLSQKTILKYGLGFAKDSWDDLKNHLLNKGYKEEDLIELNLLSSSKSKSYDRFRNRIIFPIINAKGEVIAFGGRVMDDSKPKYLNSSETPIFHKGSNLFNLNIISKEGKRDKILLVEGYMDVISLYNSGINYSVASLGTSLTENQAKIIKRYAKEVYICYDGDLAGINATNRAIDIFLSVGISPGIVSLPEGLDPDEYIKKYGKISFEGQLKSAHSYLEYRISNLREKYNLKEAKGLSDFTIAAAKILTAIKNPIEKDVYVKKFASKYKVDENVLNNYIGYLKKNTYKKEGTKVQKPKKVLNIKSGKLLAELGLISYSLKDEETYAYIKERLDIISFSNMAARIIFEELDNYYKNKMSKEDFFQGLIKKDLVTREFIDNIASMEISDYEDKKIISEYLTTLERANLIRDKENILDSIEKIAGTKSSDKNTLKELINKLQEINLKLSDLNEGGQK